MGRRRRWGLGPILILDKCTSADQRILKGTQNQEEKKYVQKNHSLGHSIIIGFKENLTWFERHKRSLSIKSWETLRIGGVFKSRRWKFICRRRKRTLLIKTGRSPWRASFEKRITRGITWRIRWRNCWIKVRLLNRGVGGCRFHTCSIKINLGAERRVSLQEKDGQCENNKHLSKEGTSDSSILKKWLKMSVWDGRFLRQLPSNSHRFYHGRVRSGQSWGHKWGRRDKTLAKHCLRKDRRAQIKKISFEKNP